MNWYLEIKLCQGTIDWHELKENFILTFSSQDGFQCINSSLEEIYATTFRIETKVSASVQPYWSAHVQHMLECYNITAEEGEEDPAM